MTKISEDRLWAIRDLPSLSGPHGVQLTEVRDMSRELLSLRTSPPPSGEAGEVTDEMVERVGERLAKLAISVDPQLVRTILTAALPTIKEPIDE
jgi:hypothetical protein